jgi:DNA-directed RNA polymerase subunit beta
VIALADRGFIERKSYGKIVSAIEMPDLLDIQIDSYNWFLQKDVPPEEREKQGLQAVFHSIFPITDVHSLYSLELSTIPLAPPNMMSRNVWNAGPPMLLPSGPRCD